MAQVETVRGAVDTARLGTTLMHEHVFVLNTEMMENYPEEWGDEAERVADAMAKLTELKGRGVDTIVDPTVIGLGRYIPRIQDINQGVDINIVAATGLYTYNDLPFWFHYRFPGTGTGGGDPMADLFVRDITQGIAGTGVRAGILKCATEEAGLTPGVERVLRAVARAHRETGVPITTHTNARAHRGRDQQRVFKEEGVDLERVVVGHSGDTTELDYLRELMDNGSTIGMDRFGIYVEITFEERVDTVARLCEMGYADRMVLSQDASCFIDWFSETARAAALPRWTYLHVTDDVVPALRERGVTEAQVHQLLVDNPRRVFERQGAY